MRFLILENDRDHARRLSAELSALGHESCAARTSARAQRFLQSLDFDAVLLSDHLLGVRPGNLADYIRLTRPSVRIVLMQGHVQIEQVWHPVFDWVVKRPISASDLLRILAHLLDNGSTRFRRSRHRDKSAGLFDVPPERPKRLN